MIITVMTLLVQHHSSLFTTVCSKSCAPPATCWSFIRIATKQGLICPGPHRHTSVSLMMIFDSKAFALCLCRSALQVLHKACEVSRRYNYFPGGIALTWMAFYESCITSEQSCVNEWNAMTDLETTRPDSPTMFVDR